MRFCVGIPLVTELLRGQAIFWIAHVAAECSAAILSSRNDVSTAMFTGPVYTTVPARIHPIYDTI